MNMLKRLFKRRYDAGRNWRYHNALRMCQVSGVRMGTVSRQDGIWVIYWLDSKQWRFRQGKVVGPISREPNDWRQFPNKRHASISNFRK